MNARAVAGITPIDSDFIENADVTLLVGGHLNYRKKLKTILRFLNIHSSIGTASWDYSTLPEELQEMMREAMTKQQQQRKRPTQLALATPIARTRKFDTEDEDGDDGDDGGGMVAGLGAKALPPLPPQPQSPAEFYQQQHQLVQDQQQQQQQQQQVAEQQLPPLPPKAHRPVPPPPSSLPQQ
jgi:hypothetical protein